MHLKHVQDGRMDTHQEELWHGDMIGGEGTLERIVEVVLYEGAVLEVGLRREQRCAVLQGRLSATSEHRRSECIKTEHTSIWGLL